MKTATRNPYRNAPEYRPANAGEVRNRLLDMIRQIPQRVKGAYGRSFEVRLSSVVHQIEREAQLVDVGREPPDLTPPHEAMLKGVVMDSGGLVAVLTMLCLKGHEPQVHTLPNPKGYGPETYVVMPDDSEQRRQIVAILDAIEGVE